jgi:GNAT superfamily N-acetyltransferase
MQTIRKMTVTDIVPCIPLAKRMASEDWYEGYPFEYARTYAVGALYCQADENFAMVAEEDGEIIGFFFGELVEYPFSSKQAAQEMAMYVVPEKRGGTIPLRFMRAFEKWARDNHAYEIMFSPSMSHRDWQMFDKMCLRLGFSRTGAVYRRKL